MTSTVVYYAHQLQNLKESKTSPYLSALLLAIFDMIDDGNIYENHIEFDAAFECAYEDAWAKYLGLTPNTSAASAVWNLAKTPLCELHAEHETALKTRNICPSPNQLKELGGWFFLQEDFYQVLQTANNRAKLRQLLITNNICVIRWSSDNDEDDTVYLEEYEELEEENEALKKRLVELRTDLSNTQNLLRQAANGKSVTVSMDKEALKKKDDTIEELNSDFIELRNQWEDLNVQFAKLKKENARLTARKEEIEKWYYRLNAEKNQFHFDQAALERLRQELSLAQTTIAELKHTNSTLKTRADKIQRLSDEIARLKKELEEKEKAFNYQSYLIEENAKKAYSSTDLATSISDAVRDRYKEVEAEFVKSTINRAMAIPYDDWMNYYFIMNSDKSTQAHDKCRVFGMASRIKANRLPTFMEAYEALCLIAPYRRELVDKTAEEKTPYVVNTPRAKAKETEKVEMAEEKEEIIYPSALLGGANKDQWKRVWEWSNQGDKLTSPQANFVRKALDNFGKVVFSKQQNSFARVVLSYAQSKGLYIAITPSVDEASNSTVTPEITTQYKSHFTHLHVSTLFGTPAPHKPILLIAIMNLIERHNYGNSLIVLGGMLEREFESVWKSLVPKDCKYSCVYWTPYWYMKSEPFWTIVPKLGCSVEGKDWLSEKEAKSMIAGARLDENLFQLMQSPAARKELKQALIEKYLTNK